MSRRLFWAAVALAGWTYAGFPAVVLARARLRPRPPREDAIEPSVSIVFAARNEAQAIGRKLDNVLALDYPLARLETIVASDGSEDETVAIAAGFGDRGIRVLALERVGKAEALNAAVAAAHCEILVFTDSNSMFEPGALRALVRPFADPEVGGVAGDQRYLRGGRTSDAVGERSYWDLDRRIKSAESAAGSTVSATGAIYAIRRELFEPVRTGVTDDFITSTAVVAQGRRLVFAPDAVAWEPPAASSRLEYRRKVRIMTRGLRGVAVRRELLDPRHTGFYAVQLASHKVLRRLMVFPVLAVALTAPRLWGRGLVYRLAVLATGAIVGLGSIGLALPATRLGRHRIAALPAFFLLVNLASLQAAWNLVTGRRIERWEPQRSTTDVEPRPSDDDEPQRSTTDSELHRGALA